MAFDVRSLRTARALTQEKLAVDASVAAPYLSRIEQGLVNPTIDVLDRLAAGLGVEIDKLLQEPPATATLTLNPLRAGRKPRSSKEGRGASSAKEAKSGD